MSILDFDMEAAEFAEYDYVIEAVMEFDVYADKIVGPTQEMGSAELPLDIDSLAAYDDFINNVMSAVAGYHSIFEHYQSPKSYAYYMKFHRKDADGNATEQRGVFIFRVATHIREGDRDSTTLSRTFKDFVPGGGKHPGTGSLIKGRQENLRGDTRRQDGRAG